MKGYGKPKDFMARAQVVGGTVVAADYCSTWGHVAWQEAGCTALGVTLPAVSRLEKDPRHGLAVIVAQNEQGLERLYELVTLAHEQAYYRPRVKWSQLADLPNCIVMIDDVLESEVREARQHVPLYVLKPRLHFLNDDLTGSVVAADVRYPTTADREKYELVSRMAHTMGDLDGEPTHMLRYSEWRRLMAQNGVAWDHMDLPMEFNAKLPKAQLLKVEGDLADRVRKSERWNDRYQVRAESELKLIREKGFESYFLFVADLVEWAKQRMLVGPGRGSAGGSVVCYLLGITEVDPLEYGTLFERFIDPGRPDLPDIDIDFPDVSRDLVFDYLRQRFGAAHVARIGTLSEFGGKSAIDDVGRVYKLPFNTVKAVKSVLDDFSQTNAHLATVDYALGHESNKQALIDFPELEEAKWIDGLPRHTGIHAAGVIVAQEPLRRFAATKDETLCLDMKGAEKLGLMKMDALGLKTLSVITDTMKMVGRDPYEIYKLPLNDPKVWEVFNDDRVTGVFQFEGQAVRGLMRRIKVGEFEDLCALTSLARPGPLSGGAADAWIVRKAGEQEFESLIPQLEKTYGLIVYQEQAMSVVRELAGFDEFDVNGFRRAIGKKDPVKLASYKQQFVDGLRENRSFLEEHQHFDAEKLWTAMEEFGSYAFNYSHAVAYSMISYYTAYLKAYYPNEFAVCYLRHTSDVDAQKAMLREIGHRNVTFFDKDRSLVDWSIQGNELVGGFINVTGIGPKMAEQMLAKREANPEGWLEDLTPSQRKRLDNPTPFDDLHYFATHYQDVYDKPHLFKIKNQVWKIEDIPAERGDYTFLGRLNKIITREKDGQEYALLFFSDDTGEMPCTANRWKWPQFKLTSDGKNFFKVGLSYVIRGDIINDGRKWLFLERARELHGPTENQADESPSGQAEGSAAEGRSPEPVDPGARATGAEGDH